MALPFDLEDVVGAALAHLLRRFALLWGCLVTGTVLAGASLLMAGMVEAVWDWAIHGWGIGSMDFPEAVELTLGLCFGFFAGLATSFGMFYGAFLIGLVIYFFKAETPHPYVWAAGAGVVALNVMGITWGEYHWWWSVVAVGFWAVLLLGLFFFARWRLMVLRVRAEIHLMGVAAENEARRRELQERTGGAVADREFALGEQWEGEDGPR